MFDQTSPLNSPKDKRQRGMLTKTDTLKLIVVSGCMLLGASMLNGCQNPGEQKVTKQEQIDIQSKAVNAWFEARFEDELARTPMTQTYLGRKKCTQILT